MNKSAFLTREDINFAILCFLASTTFLLLAYGAVVSTSSDYKYAKLTAQNSGGDSSLQNLAFGVTGSQAPHATPTGGCGCPFCCSI
jgi:hypothetical protein